MRFFFEQAGSRLCETSSYLKTYKELSEKERYENQRVVGGCGLVVENMPYFPTSRGDFWAKHIAETMDSLENEQFYSLATPGAQAPEGYGFSLEIFDEPAADQTEYFWMEHLLSQEGFSSNTTKQQLFQAIANEDQEAFTQLLTQENKDFRDLHGASLVHKAAEAKNAFFLQKLISMRASLSQQDGEGLSPLHYAARAGCIENCALLQSHAIPIDIQALNGATPLYLAVQRNQLETVNFLLSKKANPNSRVVHGMTPLICAVHHNHQAIAEALLSCHTTAIDATMEDGSTALFVAVSMMLPSMVELLIAKGADVNKPRKDSFTPFLLAFKSAPLYFCELFLNCRRTNLNTLLLSKQTALHLAVERSSSIYTETLLAYDADIFLKSWDGETPLMAAVRARNGEVVWLILDHCRRFKTNKLAGYLAEKNIHGDTALSLAFRLRVGDAVEGLLSYRDKEPPANVFLGQLAAANVKFNFLSNRAIALVAGKEITQEDVDKAYYVACQHGNFPSYAALRSSYLSPRLFVDEKGWTPTHFKVLFNDSEEVDAFLRTKPEDLLQITKDGMSLAAIAAKHGNTDVLKKLVAAMLKSDVSFEKQYRGHHLLLAAMESKDIATVDAVCFYMYTSNIILDEQGRAPPHFAAMWGNVEMLDLFRRRNTNILALDRLGKTPLHYALEYGWDEVVEFFLDPDLSLLIPKNIFSSLTKETSPKIVDKLLRYIDCNEKDPVTGKTPIFFSIEANNFPAFMTLISHGADLMVRCTDGTTPFLMAVGLDRIEYLALLYERGATLTPNGKNALHLAAELGHERTTSFLLDMKMNPEAKTPEGKTPADIAKLKKFPNIEALLTGKKNTLLFHKKKLVDTLKNEQKDEFLRLAKALPLNHPMVFSIDGHEFFGPLLHLVHLVIHSEDIARKFTSAFLSLPGTQRDVRGIDGITLDQLLVLLRKQIDIDTVDFKKRDDQGATILHYIASSDDKDSEELLEKVLPKVDSVDVENIHGITPLMLAIGENNERKVELLLQKNANPNHLSRKQLTPLIIAVEKGAIAIVHLLVQHGAQVNQRGGHSKITPLHAATEKGNFGLVQFLVDNGANPNMKMAHGITPLHVASRRGDFNLLFYLERAGGDSFAVDDDGWTIAHHAALSERPEIFYYLKMHKFTLNEKNHSVKGVRNGSRLTGLTPLHIAARQGNVLAVRTLLALGADSTLLSDHETSPLALSGQSGNRKTLKCFLDKPIYQNEKQKKLTAKMIIMRDAVACLKLLLPTKEALSLGLDAYQTSVAHFAASYDSVKVLQLLNSEEVSLKEKDFKGRTPFEVSLQENKLLAARYLLSETDAVSFDEKASTGSPFLHFVCQRSFLSLAELLISVGAPLEEQDLLERTPLHHALLQKDEKMVSLLLSSGAEIDVRAMREFMPKGHMGIQKLMQEYAREKR